MALGTIDGQGTVVSGWAVDFSVQGLRCAIDVYVNHEKMLTFCTGSVSRSDVQAVLSAGKDGDIFKFHDLYGFRVDIAPLLAATKNLVELRFSMSGELMANGSFEVDASGVAEYRHLNFFEGPHGYIFYTDDSNSTLDQLAGIALSPDVDRIDAFCRNFAVLETALRSSRIGFSLSIVPERAVLAPGEVKEGYAVSSERPVMQVLTHALQKYGISLDYPVDRLQAFELTKVCSKTDSHISQIAFHQIVKSASKDLAKERLAQIDDEVAFEWIMNEKIGDLAHIRGCGEPEAFYVPAFSSEPIELFDTAKLRFQPGFTDNAAMFYKASATPGFAIVFGTSSARCALAFVSQMYQLTLHIWTNDIDLSLIRQLRPDHVFAFITEKVIHNLEFNIDYKCAPQVRVQSEYITDLYRKGVLEASLNNPDLDPPASRPRRTRKTR